MSNGGGLIETVLSGLAIAISGTSGKSKLPSGERFSLSYVSGHPSFPVPDDGGWLLVAKEGLHYILGTRGMAFEIPKGLVHEARLVTGGMLVLRLQGADGIPLDLSFQGTEAQINGALSELGLG